VSLAVLAPASGAYAQSTSCGQAPAPRADFELIPGDGARNVARDAPIWVRYSSAEALDSARQSVSDEPTDEPSRAPCAGALVCLLDKSEPDRSIAARVLPAGEARVVLVPERLLEPSTEHWVLVARPFLDRASRAESELTTGDSVDRESPELPFGDDDLSLEVSALAPECDAAPGSVRLSLEIPKPSDDTDAESVSVLVFLSRAAELHAPELLATVLNRGEPLRADVVLSPAQARERACIALRAVDGVGRISDDEVEACFHPSRDVAFASGCGVVLGRERSVDLRWVVSGLAGLLVRLRRKRAPARVPTETRSADRNSATLGRPAPTERAGMRSS
jgi:hypothetical protein